ncbi:phage holin family protein [Plantactinospora sp. WMMB334]|uniref:phage holin family protein n=1 Tax=Plantactinospora sp. WMMB334 TaxID=3404119 RepID=UPI003B94E7B5
MAEVVRESARPVAEQSTAELVQRATEQLSRLVRDELALARMELAEKGRHAGIGIGLFGGGGVMALFGFAVLVTAAVLGLAVVIPGWAAALVVAGALFLLAGVLALVGRRQVRRAVPPTPSAAADSLRADVRTVATAVRDRGQG